MGIINRDKSQIIRLEIYSLVILIIVISSSD